LVEILSYGPFPDAKRKSLVHEHGRGNKAQGAQAIDESEEDALSLKRENSGTSI